MHHDVAGRGEIDRQDVPGNAGGEGQLAGCSHGAVLGHEEAAASGHALNGSENAASAAELRVGGHLDGRAHPGKLACLGNN